MTVLRALTARPSPQNSSLGLTAWGDWGTSGNATWSGQSVSNEQSVRLLTVYGCARFIADGISTLPLDVLRRRPDGSPEPVRTPALLESPTTDLDFIAWAGQVLLSDLLAGDAYVYLGRSAGGPVSEMVPLDPDTVKVERVGNRKTYRVNGEEVPSFMIGHIPALMFPGSDTGLSPVEMARQTIGQGMSAQEFGARFFGQGASLSGVIEVPGELLPDKARELARAWAKKHGGPSKSNLPGVLEGGASWKPTGVTNEQSQFLQTRKFTASEICAQMFLIDPAEMGLPVDGSSLTYANLEQRNARKVQVTFLPWITRLERFLTALLPRPQYVKFNVNGLLRGDMKTRYESYAIGIENEFITPNQAREHEDWQPLPGGDEIVKNAPGAPVDRTEPRNGAPVVIVDPAQIHVDAPTIPAPVVNVSQDARNETTQRTVERDDAGRVTQITESTAPTAKRIERDALGRAVRVIEEDSDGAPVTVRNIERDPDGRVIRVAEVV